MRSETERRFLEYFFIFQILFSHSDPGFSPVTQSYCLVGSGSCLSNTGLKSGVNDRTKSETELVLFLEIINNSPLSALE